MAQYNDREHYIPLRRSELVELLCRDPAMSGVDAHRFRQLCDMISATIHFEYHCQLETLKDTYTHFDPDLETRSLDDPANSDPGQDLEKLFNTLQHVLNKGNFKQVRIEDLQQAMQSASDWGINMNVDFEVFERLAIFARGDGLGKRTRRRMRNWWRPEEIEIPVFRRMVLFVKLRPHKSLGPHADTRAVFLKMFKDVPKQDIEMLLPGARLRMPGSARGRLGASLLSTVGFIIYKMGADLGHFAFEGFVRRNPLALWGPFSLIAGYAYRQYYGYQQTKQTYHLQLTKSLYYQCLDNNSGVLYRLLDEAEEQECREAILAYFLLLTRASKDGWTCREIDDNAEAYLAERANLQVDFEIADALDKLKRMDIVESEGDRHRSRAVPEALSRLDHAWDRFFDFSGRNAPSLTPNPQAGAS